MNAGAYVTLQHILELLHKSTTCRQIGDLSFGTQKTRTSRGNRARLPRHEGTTVSALMQRWAGELACVAIASLSAKPASDKVINHRSCPWHSLRFAR
jgi:hypothetical protein